MPFSKQADIEKIIGKPLRPAPVWPAGELLGLMAYKKDEPKYEVDESGALVGLNLAGCGLDDDRWAKVLACIDPGCLRALNLGDNQLTRLDLPADMPALELLNLNGNKNLAELAFPASGLPRLRRADLNECAFRELTVPANTRALEALHLRFGKLERLVFEGECPVLETLDLRENQLAQLTLPAALPRLWYLNVDKNQLRELRLPADMPQLSALYLRDNQLTQLEPLQLDLRPDLDALYLHGNPWLLDQALLPDGRTDNSIGPIRAFLAGLAGGEEINDRVKIIVVGNGRVGKTSLLRRLRDEELNPHEKYTHGLALGTLDKKEYLPGVNTDTLRAALWDFGGQEIFYAAHQFFLTKGALYLLCWTDEAFVQAYRANSDAADRIFDDAWRPVDYWLENIRLHGGDSPTLLVQTHCDRGNLPLPAGIDARYTADALRFSATEKYAYTVPALREGMARKINEGIPDFGGRFPRSYNRLIDAVAARREQEPFIDRAAFDQIALDANIQAEYVGEALNYLVRSGVVVYFGDLEGLKEVVYIDPNWLTEQVYKLFKNDLIEKKGRFDDRYLQERFPEYTPEMRARFLQLLYRFELIFEEKKAGNPTGRWVAPHYLPDELEEDASRLLERDLKKQELRCVFRFARFMPENVMINFLSRYGEYAGEVIWKSGISFDDNRHEGVSCTVMLHPVEKALWVYTTKGDEGLQPMRRILDEFSALSKGAQAELSVDGKRFVSWQKLLEKHTGQHIEIEDIDGKTLLCSTFRHLLEPGYTASKTNAADANLERNSITAAILEFIRDLNTDSEQNAPTPAVQPRNTPDNVAVRKAKILFLSANPTDLSYLQTNQEYRKIKNELSRGSARDSFEFLLPELSVTIMDLIRAVGIKPEFIHFAGHGTESGILLATENNKAQLMPVPALERLFKPLKGYTKYVVMNSCYSATQAEVISRFGIYVVGHNLPVGDEAAISFSEGFYLGIGEGKTFEDAFNDAMIVILTRHLENAPIVEVWKDGEKLDI